MLTIKYLEEKKYPTDHVLTDEDKKALLKENEGGNYSYLCLMKEMFSYSHITVESLLIGWGGVRLVTFDDKPTSVFDRRADDAWCKCDDDHGVNFFDDGNTQYYGKDKIPVNKHHYACCGCQKLKQIG